MNVSNGLGVTEMSGAIMNTVFTDNSLKKLSGEELGSLISQMHIEVDVLQQAIREVKEEINDRVKGN